MWVIRHSTVDWVYSKTQILLATLRIKNQHQGESYVSLEVEHLFPQVGCARNKRECLTVSQNRLKFGLTCQKQLRKWKKQECIYFIDPEDGEHKETITNARTSWTFRWRRLCLARWERKSARTSCRTLYARQENPRESVWNPLFLEVMKITSR